MFICGTGSFNHRHHHEDDEVEKEGGNSPCSTPKRSKKNLCKIICKGNAGNKNPYADRGLDKFYALLADLDDKKQKIYKQKGSEDISFVRFVYTNSDHVKPIVVKVKDKDKNLLVEQRSFKGNASPPEKEEKEEEEKIIVPQLEDDRKVMKKKKRRCLIRSCNGAYSSFKITPQQQPRFYFAAMVVMILLFLAIYGRSFAILCTSIGWYLAPTIVGSSSSSTNERKPKRKKKEVEDYVMRRQIHEKKLVAAAAGPSSPKSVINGLMNDAPTLVQQQHHRKKSW